LNFVSGTEFLDGTLAVLFLEKESGINCIMNMVGCFYYRFNYK